MFRARVAAQGFTVVAMVAGSMYYSGDRQKTKELRRLKEEKDAEEKRQSWIRELEARDEEDKLMRAAMEERRRQKMDAAAAAAAATGEQGLAQGTGGGVLGKMGLWSQGQEKAGKEAEAEAAVAAGTERREKKRKENPKSSLGAIGEALAKDKEGGSKK